MNQKQHKHIRRVLKLMYYNQNKRLPTKEELRIIEKEAKRNG